MLAYTWPLLNLLWTFLMFAGIFLLLFFVIWCFIDNFRRRDHSGWAKGGWTVVILMIPPMRIAYQADSFENALRTSAISS